LISKRRVGIVALLAGLGLATSCGGAAGSGTQEAATKTAAPPNFQQVTTIPLPGSGGHGDLVVYDSAKKAVYLAHHGDDMVVIDTKTNKVTQDVKVGKDPNGIAFDSSYLYVTTGSDNTLAVVSRSGWNVLKQVPSKGTGPDGIWLDPASQKLFVISDGDNTVEVFSGGSSPTLTSTIPLLPEKPQTGPDVGVLVPSKKRLYQPSDALVEIVDIASGKVTKSVDTKIPLANNGATKNMVYDPRTNRLWVATTAKKVLILNADTLETIGSIPTTTSDDQLAIDPGRRLVYAFGGTGFDTFDADRMVKVASVDTGSQITHTGTVDTDTHNVYVYEGAANVVGVYRG
jgi:YVTN family beta-propeller protein